MQRFDSTLCQFNMKKSFASVLLFNVIIILILFGCHNSKESTQCLSYSNATITSVTGPDSGMVNQYLDFAVSFGMGGCDHFNGFQQTSNGDTTIIAVNIKHLGCVCPDYEVLVDSVYKFKAAVAGVYYIKFLQTENTYILDTLKIK